MKSAKKTKIAKKSSKKSYQKIQIFFVGLASLLILVTSISLSQQNNNAESGTSHGKVLSENIKNLFPSKQVGGTANTTTQVSTAPVVNTQPSTAPIAQPSTAPINTNTNTNTLLPTPTLYCVGSIGGVCPTLTPSQGTGVNTVANTNTTTNTNCNSTGNILMQLLSDLISFFNALFGLNISLPNVGCTVATNTNTNANTVINNNNTNNNTTATNIVTPIPVVTYAIPVAVVPSIAAITQAPVAITQAPAPVANVTVFPQQDSLSNWAGYIYSLPGGATGATLRSTWNVSQVTCNQSGDYSPWIGFGGSSQNDPNIAQLGVDFACMNGQATYSPWTEAYPANSIYYNNDAVSVGDQISQTVTFQGNGTFMTNMTDTAKGWSISLPMSFGGGYTPQSGEVVSELVFGTVPPYSPPTNFTNNFFSNNGQTEQPLVNATGFVRTDISQKGSNVALTQTSALTTNGFTVGFK